MNLQSGSDVYVPSFEAGWRPDPRMTVSEWADEKRWIGAKSGHAPIKWKTSTTPYVREIMDALGPREPCREVVFIKGSQVAGTETGNNWLGYLIDLAPSAILVVRPSIDEARRFSRQRLDPMFAATPALAKLVEPPRSRDGGNTRLSKEFPGGVLFLVGANSATGVKSMPIRYLFADEVDEYPFDIGGQGDPLALAMKRLSGPNFSRRKVLLVGTPTIKGLSRIEAEFLETDQRRYFVPCPYCDNFDWIRWENIRYTDNDPSTAALGCVSCGTLIEERFKVEMLPRGEWRPTAEATSPEKIGFHLSSLYSPFGWYPWSSAVDEWLKARYERTKLRVFMNTVLGQTWEERGDSVDPESLLSRAERYEAPVPDGVGVLVAAVDVQDDRLEVKVKGYGAAEESWLIDYYAIRGDPATDPVWFDLDRALSARYRHVSGREVAIACVAVDTGGHFTDEAYRFCAARFDRRIFGIKGGSERGKPLVGKASRKNRYRIRLFTLCVNTGKGAVYSRLLIESPGPGYCHFPEADFFNEEYVAQLTAEKAIPKELPGRGRVREWVKIRERNEALDLEVYCLAALYILGPSLVRALPERAAALSKPVTEPAKPTVVERTGPTVPRPRGYIDGYKG